MKGNSLVGVFVGLFLVCIVAVTMALPLVSSIIGDATTLSNETNESITFVANNTWYPIANTPVSSVTALYNNSAHAETILATKYLNNETHIKIYTNSTLGGTNNVTNTTYYLSYLWEGDAYVSDSSTQVILLLIPLFIGIAILVIVTKAIRM